MHTAESAPEPLRPPEVDAPDPAGFDAHGIEPVPTRFRTSTALDQFWIWAGANVAPINWVLGTLGITMGLSLLETIAVIVVGNLLGGALFGVFCLMGHRTGVNQMTLSRSAFGRRGAYIPAAVQILMPMAWVGINTWVVLDLCVAALERLGISGGSGLRYVVAAAVMVIQVGIAVWGFYAIRAFERWTMPVIVVVMLVMTVVALTRVDIQWTGGLVSGVDKFAAVTQLMTAIGIGWGMSWLVYASDYSRFTKPSLSSRRVFAGTALGMALPTIWLASLGAAIASAGGGTDPAQLVVTAFGALALPVLVLILHGPVATNIVVIYSSALAALSMDLKVARWKISVAAGVFGSVALVAFIEAGDFATAFDQWMVSMVVWIGPWAAICLVDFFVLRRGRIDVPQLYADPSRSVRDVNWAALCALGLGLVAAWATQMGLVEAMQGPVALAWGGADLSWLAGMLVAGGTYYGFEFTRRGRSPGRRPPV